MGVRPEHRWLLLTALVVGALLLLSALAMNRPNVVWEDGKPHCPGCRHDVHAYANRCADCRFEFDWVVADEEDSPVSPFILTPTEKRALDAAVKRLGKEEASKRVAAATGLKPEDAARYLDSLSRGDCGYCAGTGDHLSGSGDCPVCFGEETCITVDDDETFRVRLGDEDAARELARLKLAIEVIGEPAEGDEGAAARDEIRELVAEYVDDNAGAIEAARIPVIPQLFATGPAVPKREVVRSTAELARVRIAMVLKALAAN